MKNVSRERVRRTRGELLRLAHAGLDWVAFSMQANEILRAQIPFQRGCWHGVDPGTVLFTRTVTENLACSGHWLAQHEYVIEDVNKWWFLARSGRRAGALSIATHGDLSRSARFSSMQDAGVQDELRASLVVDGTYWGAIGFLRDEGQGFYTEADVELLLGCVDALAEGYRRSIAVAAIAAEPRADNAPGVVVFDAQGQLESISAAAERWISEIIEIPPPATAADSKVVQAVAARARSLSAGDDPLHLEARSRVQTRSGDWLLLYGSVLTGDSGGRTAVIIQPAMMNDVAPLLALAYGLTERECQIARLCIDGRSTKEIAQALDLSPFTVQDHLKSIFSKTGAHSRGELVGRVFLDHYMPRWKVRTHPPAGWLVRDSDDVKH